LVIGCLLAFGKVRLPIEVTGSPEDGWNGGPLEFFALALA